MNPIRQPDKGDPLQTAVPARSMEGMQRKLVICGNPEPGKLARLHFRGARLI
jgi:hypothetical protein